MANLSTKTHPEWGLDISQYSRIYCHEALVTKHGALVNTPRQTMWRLTALDTIEEICILADPNPKSYEYTDLYARIPLAELKTVLDPTCFPFELDIFASPKLVAGCITLMSSVKPSPFEYEYGYLCFRLLTIALNTCLLKTVDRLDNIIQTMSNTHVGQLDLRIFNESAGLIDERLDLWVAKSIKKTTLMPLGLWVTDLPLDALLKILDDDQKNFFTLMRESNSSEYLVLIYALWRYVETKKAGLDEEKWLEKIFKPYHSIVARYQLVLPNTEPEQGITGFILEHIQDTAHWHTPRFIDLPDSKSVVEACVDYFERPGPAKKPLHIEFFLNFVQPHIPGYEDLIPTMFQASVKLLWRSLSLDCKFYWSIGDSLASLLYHFCQMLERSKVACGNDQPWVLRLVDILIKEDFIDLFIIVILLLEPGLNSGGGEDTTTNISALTGNLFAVIDLLPSDYLSAQLFTSGAFNNWLKYFINFVAGWSFEHPDSTISTPPSHIRLVGRLFANIIGDDWVKRIPEFNVTGFCGNPRCSDPEGAKYYCPTELDSVYCGTKCLAFVRYEYTRSFKFYLYDQHGRISVSRCKY